MNSSTFTRNPDLIKAIVGVVITSIAAYIFIRLTLDNVSGVIRGPNWDCCWGKDFSNDEFFWPMFALAIPIWWVTRLSLRAGILAFIIATSASFYISYTIVGRYSDSERGYGLEVIAIQFFASVGSAAHAVIFLVALLFGVSSFRKRNKKRELSANGAVV